MNKTMFGVGRFGHCDNTKEDFKIIEIASKRPCMYRHSIFKTSIIMAGKLSSLIKNYEII